MPDSAVDSSFAIRAPHIELRGITVRFGSVTALEDVDLILTPGERHAIVGENGAGKSTLMKVLFGLITPDAGTILVNGTPQQFTSPADAIAREIGMVQQHFELIPSFTVAENILLGAEVTGKFGTLDRWKGKDEILYLVQRSGLSIDPERRVGELSVAAQQRVEILKALYRRARVLILDEPTAVLAPSEARDLWAAVQHLSGYGKDISEEGSTIVFITHKLDEVMANADTVTVLRRGKKIFSVGVKDTNPVVLATGMVGETVVGGRWSVVGERDEGRNNHNHLPDLKSSTDSQSGADHRLPVRGGPPTPSPGWTTNHHALNIQNLTVNGLRGECAVDSVSLDIQPGEIVGLAGVDGSGQMELIEAILGLRKVESGQILLEGTDVTAKTVAQRRGAGMGYIPDDRHHRAVSLPLPCEENAILGRQREPEFSAGGWLKSSALRGFLETACQTFDVRGAGWRVPLRALSGGNQQKLVLARELSRQPRLLLAAQPTRGLDFAATAFVHQTLRSERDRGTAILLQSLDLVEVLALSDRVAVMLQGRIVAVLDQTEATEERVGALMTAAGGGGT